MGFGFNLYFIFIIIPLIGILLTVWLLSQKRRLGKILGFFWLGLFGLTLLLVITNWIKAKTELDKKDYYGEYIINRDYFKGKQTDWQYNHFRFEITEQDSIFFHITENEKIVQTYCGTIKTTTPYNSARLIIQMEQPTSHIFKSNPTTYRSAWSFYLVFNSPKFYNVFFKKGSWESIE